MAHSSTLFRTVAIAVFVSVLLVKFQAGFAHAAAVTANKTTGLSSGTEAFHAATRLQQELAAGDGSSGTPCRDTSVSEAIVLVYERDDITAASNLAKRCEAQAITQGQSANRIVAARIRGLIAMKTKDMATLKAAGESLVSSSPAPDDVADGHMFIAFACLFSDDTKCARLHVDRAKAMFVQRGQVDALTQLSYIERALIKVESSALNP